MQNLAGAVGGISDFVSPPYNLQSFPKMRRRHHLRLCSAQDSSPRINIVYKEKRHTGFMFWWPGGFRRGMVELSYVTSEAVLIR